MRIVLDTNVILSAVLFGGKPRQVLDLVLSGRLDLSLSEAIISELRGVLARPKFGLTAPTIESMIGELTSVAEWVVPTRNLEVIADDPSDNEILNCAVEARADYIVSGDVHLLTLGKLGDIVIVNPETFLGIRSRKE